MNEPEVKAIEPEGINVILTVELRKDGQYYVVFNGQDYALLTPVQVQQEYKIEWRKPVVHFQFSTMHLEERK